MRVSKDEIIAILSQFNPWWRGDGIPDLSTWQRNAQKQVRSWINSPPTHRALMISGARQVGKTTLILQVIDDLLRDNKAHPANILYVTFDHPILKLVGVDAVLDAWREKVPKQEGREFIFLDEIQFMDDWEIWVKHQVDFSKQRQITFTGSAMTLREEKKESGYGRWETIRLSTLSFDEYIHLKKLNLPSLPKLQALEELFSWDNSTFEKVSNMATSYTEHFHDYLIRGGFPQTALLESVTQSQRLLREDIIDRALKRDITALFGVRRVLDLEQTFLYLCMHDSGLLDMMALCSNLGVPRPTAQNFIDILEATHLIYRLRPFGYGKEVLRGRYKIYLADAAIAPAVLLKGKSILDDPQALGVSVETAVYKHLATRHYQQQNVGFTYWKGGTKDFEVDFVAEVEGQTLPFEVKYRTQHTQPADLQGLLNFCDQKNLDKGYVITKSLKDFGLMEGIQSTKIRILRIPAALLCYWMGEAELISTAKNQIKKWKLEEAEYMTNPKKHHYVPQFLLREFLPPNEDQLFVYDTKNEKIRPQKTKEIACESNFYSILTDGKSDKQLEKKFSHIEGKAAGVIKRFKQRAPLNEEDKETLARFIALSRVRTPTFLNNLAKLEVNFTEAEFFKKTQDIDFTQERTKEISRDLILKHSFFWWYWEFLEEKILSMKWSLFEAPYGRAFITSDNPLCSILKPSESNQNGVSIIQEFDDRSLRLFLPLSKNHAWLGHMEFDKDDYYQADDSWMTMFERNCVIWANRYVYASTDDTAILEHAIEYKDICPFDITLPEDERSGFVHSRVKAKRVSEGGETA